MESRWNKDFMDTVNMLSFVLGVANYRENLSQNDKDDIMQSIDRKTSALLICLEKDLEDQNELLRRILSHLEGEDNES